MKKLTLILCSLSPFSVWAATLYVALNSPNPTPPYTTWATAAANIQYAVNAAETGDEIVVSNGVYAGGVSVNKPLTLLGVNGPQFTIINGGGANQCVYLGSGASLSGFTLTNGVAYQGGGVYCAPSAVVSNCTIIGNSASYGGGVGGGTPYTDSHGGIFYNCTITGNSAYVGGGADRATFYNCTFTGNSASYGGGFGTARCTTARSPATRQIHSAEVPILARSTTASFISIPLRTQRITVAIAL